MISREVENLLIRTPGLDPHLFFDRRTLAFLFGNEMRPYSLPDLDRLLSFSDTYSRPAVETAFQMPCLDEEAAKRIMPLSIVSLSSLEEVIPIIAPVTFLRRSVATFAKKSNNPDQVATQVGLMAHDFDPLCALISKLTDSTEGPARLRPHVFIANEKRRKLAETYDSILNLWGLALHGDRDHDFCMLLGAFCYFYAEQVLPMFPHLKVTGDTGEQTFDQSGSIKDLGKSVQKMARMLIDSWSLQRAVQYQSELNSLYLSHEQKQTLINPKVRLSITDGESVMWLMIELDSLTFYECKSPDGASVPGHLIVEVDDLKSFVQSPEELRQHSPGKALSVSAQLSFIYAAAFGLALQQDLVFNRDITQKTDQCFTVSWDEIARSHRKVEVRIRLRSPNEKTEQFDIWDVQIPDSFRADFDRWLKSFFLPSVQEHRALLASQVTYRVPQK